MIRDRSEWRDERAILVIGGRSLVMEMVEVEVVVEEEEQEGEGEERAEGTRVMMPIVRWGLISSSFPTLSHLISFLSFRLMMLVDSDDVVVLDDVSVHATSRWKYPPLIPTHPREREDSSSVFPSDQRPCRIVSFDHDGYSKSSRRRVEPARPE